MRNFIIPLSENSPQLWIPDGGYHMNEKRKQGFLFFIPIFILFLCMTCMTVFCLRTYQQNTSKYISAFFQTAAEAPMSFSFINFKIFLEHSYESFVLPSSFREHQTNTLR